MEKEKIKLVIFCITAIVAGIISNFTSTSALSILLPFLVYIFACIIISEISKIEEKLLQLILKNLPIFILVWMITWTVLYNL